MAKPEQTTFLTVTRKAVDREITVLPVNYSDSSQTVNVGLNNYFHYIHAHCSLGM